MSQSRMSTDHTAPDTEPLWFREAIARAPRFGQIKHDGIELATREWGEANPAQRDVVLIHGGAAHSGWWDHIGPLLAGDRQVIAFDLSGHGDSGRRTRYGMDLWVGEALAVIEARTASPPPVVIGHSLGGIVATALARSLPSVVGGVIVVDSPLSLVGRDEPATRRDVPARRHRIHPTRAAAQARFRPIPRQDSLPYIANHVARQSIREVDGGWTWKFDPALADATRDAAPTSYGGGCPTVFVVSENGILLPESRRSLADSTDVTVVDLPGAGHAPMLDRPLEFIALVQSALIGSTLRAETP